jgi:hypothetical protein
VAEDVVLVLTMGRVGSTATFRAVQELPGLESLHIHHLHRGSLVRRGGPHTLVPRARDRTARNVRDGFRARELMRDANRPVKVVTLVRDVVERNLSVGFARLRSEGNAEELGRLVGDRRLVEEIWSQVDVDLPYTWFDKEIRRTLGIDVFARPFPAAGHDRFRQGRVDLLVMRSDLGDDTKSGAVSDLVGQEVVVGRNSALTHDGGPLEDVYDRFRRAVPLTDDDLRKAAESQLMQHFFAVDVEEYVDGWRQRLRG